MVKRVFIVHGWDGYPGEGWFPWLQQELEVRGFEVHVPQLPNASEPRIQPWVSTLSQAVRLVDAETYFVGHSIGCQTIARYLETLPEGTGIGGAVFVAGFFNRLTNLEDDDVVHDVAKEWLERPLDFAKVKAHLPKSIAIFSDNDPYVPLDNQHDFRKKLGSKIMIEKSMGHFSGSTGTTALPVALDAVLELAES